MIVTLLLTLLLEGAIAFGYCVWRNKPVQPILLTSIFINLITQSLLWLTLNLFFRQYLIALIVAELLIWLMEGAVLYFVPANRLSFANALLLSLGMNLVSFGLGWFLPV